MYRGAQIDERSKEIRSSDYRHEEAPFLAGAPIFSPKSVEEIAFYELRDQDGSSTCVNQSYAKLRGILTKKKAGRYVSLSGGYIYRRKRTADLGMTLWDVMELGKANGLPFEVIDPSQKMNELDIVSTQELPYTDEVAKLFLDENERFFYLPNDFDAIAEVISSGYPVIILHFGDWDEYNIVPSVKKVLKLEDAPIRHAICAHDLIQHNGNDYIVMDDSWGVLNSAANDEYENKLKLRGQRLLSREWINARCFGAAYIRDLTFSFEPPKSYQFIKPLYFIPWNDITNAPSDPALNDGQRDEVVELQKFLKAKGFFPQIPETGYYGALTAKAVKDWQVANWEKFYAINKQWTKDALINLNGEVFGKLSIQIANI